MRYLITGGAAFIGSHLADPSSSEVYGKGAGVPFSEDDDVVVGADEDDALL
jgi:hypothetical protein